MNKIDKALDYFLKYILYPDKRMVKAREYLRKFQQVRDSMNPKEFQRLRTIFAGRTKEKSREEGG